MVVVALEELHELANFSRNRHRRLTVRWLVNVVPRASTRCGAIPFACGYFITTGWYWVGVKAVAGRPGRVRDRWGAGEQSDRPRIPGMAGMSAAERDALYHRIPEGERMKNTDSAVRGKDTTRIPSGKARYNASPSGLALAEQGGRGCPPLQPCNRATVQVRRQM